MKSRVACFSTSRICAGLALAGLSATLTPAALAANESAVLEEVIVTARKVQESMQDVPIAVSAFTGQQIDNLVMRDIREMEGFVPNLVIDPVSVAPAGASLYIRGVGTQEVERTFDPAVGVTIDGIPLSFVNGSMANTFDFAAMEVLRGPQGTLFGRNTTGGVINISRTRPTGEMGLKYEVTAGDDDLLDFKGVANFPIIKDKLAGKLAYAQQKDGGQRKNGLTGDDIGNADNKEYNVTLLWTPAETFEALVTYVRYEDNNDGVPLQNIASFNFDNPVNPEPDLPCLLGFCGSDVTDISTMHQDFYSRDIDFTWDSIGLVMNWDIGIGTITSLTGYQETDEDVPTDFDATPLNFFHTMRAQESDQTSTELRFASSDEFSEDWDFVIGAFYLEDHYNLEQETSIAAFGGPDGALFQNPFASQDRDSWAVFGEAHFNFGEAWTLTLGGRYTEEKKEYSGEIFFGGGPIAGYLPGGVDDFYVFGTPIWVPISAAEADKDWNEFTPKAGIDYRVNDDVLVYFSYAEGFRSGGFNGRNQKPENIGPYDPEYVDNYEIGLKGDFLDNTLRLNLAAFYVDYQDKQEETIQPDGFGGSNTVVQNASTVESSGVEAELTWVLNEYLTFNGNFGYLDASYDSYVADLNGDGVATDNSDLELRRVPEWTGGANLVFTMPMGPGNLSAFAGVRYTDEYWVEAANDPRGLLDDRTVVDASVSYEWDYSSSRSVKVTAYGRDLTDEEAFSSAVTIPATIAFAGVSGGRQYGVRISGNF
jgi:iron complex outermembrane receptor protein